MKRRVEQADGNRAAGHEILINPAAAFVKEFFSTLGKKTAEAAWDGAAEWKKNKDLKPLADVVAALVAAADLVGGEVKIVIGLNIPDDHFGTVLWTDSRGSLRGGPDPVSLRRTRGEAL